MNKCDGKIIEVTGSIVEVEWRDNPPNINHILKACDDSEISLAVISSASPTSVFCIALNLEKNIRRGTDIYNTGEPFSIPVGENVLGRVFTLFGNPLDKLPKIPKNITKPIIESVKTELNDIIIPDEILETGIKTIDFFTPLLKGGKIGLVGGAGLGKTVLLSQLINRFVIQKNKENNNVAVFSAVGERSREALDIYEDLRDAKVLSKTSLIIGQMGESPAVRWYTAYASVAIAEYFRESMKKDVFFFMDNIYRFVQAGNELSTLTRAIPSEDGYQPTLPSEMASLSQRLASTKQGVITSVLALFVPSDDTNNAAVRSILHYLDTIIILSRDIFQQGLFPAINILASSSVALNERIVGKKHYLAYTEAKQLLEKAANLERIVSLVGEQELSTDNQVSYQRSKRLRNYMTQDFHMDKSKNDNSLFIERQDTVKDVIDIVSGKYDHLAPDKFLFIGRAKEAESEKK